MRSAEDGNFDSASKHIACSEPCYLGGRGIVASSLRASPAHTVDYTLILHVKEVIDRGELLSDLPVAYLPDDGEDLTRRHTFKTWRGKIDGSGSGDHGLA